MQENGFGGDFATLSPVSWCAQGWEVKVWLCGTCWAAYAGCGIIAHGCPEPKTGVWDVNRAASYPVTGHSRQVGVARRQWAQPTQSTQPRPASHHIHTCSRFGRTWPDIQGQRVAQGPRILASHRRAITIFREELCLGEGERAVIPNLLPKSFQKGHQTPILCLVPKPLS